MNFQHIQSDIKQKQPRKQFTFEEDKMLKKAVSDVGDNDWEKVYAEYSIKYESNYIYYVLYDDKSMAINLEGEFLDGDWLFIFLEMGRNIL